ncbi:ubiquitin-conjugating enzyme E2 Z-like isoform X2 [Ornithodoros turicata]|uniref:ubiquitin-conjugating enzyme E2 Z-like isoform X2 n=1 Tax=Ornithodoros turicata TaxID=34597 RepID=UPI00313A39C0
MDENIDDNDTASSSTPMTNESSDSLDGLSYSWDPYAHEHEIPSPQCLLRTKRDIVDIHAEPPPGVIIVPDEKNITRCPPDYPIQPPRVRLMTTGYGSVRFNPNLYRNGKVCLSILGTWAGPAWSPAQSLASVLISIQSLMNDRPYHNEPGYEKEKSPGDADRYNEIIRHETIRVAVCDMVESCLTDVFGPPALRETIEKAFPDYFEYYETVVKNKLHLSGLAMCDPFGEHRGVFQYSTLLTRLRTLRDRLKEKTLKCASS